MCNKENFSAKKASVSLCIAASYQLPLAISLRLQGGGIPEGVNPPEGHGMNFTVVRSGIP